MIAVYLEAGNVSVRQVDVPQPQSGSALIRLLRAGICNTDLELQRGYYGFSGIPGHEFVGEVVEGSREWVGKRVVGEINLACQRCAECLEGMGRHCATRKVLGIVQHPGAFAEYLTLPERNLLEVPDTVSTDHAVFTEPLAAACEILEQVAIPKGEPVAVLGNGKLGSLIAQVLTRNGAKVSRFGRHAEKPRSAFRFVVDATGSAQGLKEAIAACRPRGTVIMKSTLQGEVLLDTAPIIVNEITMVGSRCGRFAPALELLRTGDVDVASLIDSSFALKDAPAAFERAGQTGVMKVLLG